MDKFKKDTFYLVKEGYSPYTPIRKIKIIDITETCYEIQWKGGNTSFELKKQFEERNSIVEQLITV